MIKYVSTYRADETSQFPYGLAESIDVKSKSILEHVGSNERNFLLETNI